MELHPLGPCLIIDTAGFDDEGPVGELRNERTRRVLDQADMALVVIDRTDDLSLETQWVKNLQRREVPFLVVLNKADLLADVKASVNMAQTTLGAPVVAVSAREASGMDALREAMAALVGDEAVVSLTGDLAHRGDIVLLVMPQDPQSPKGRLILPQVQTIRDLLDKDCTVVCCTAAGLENALAALKTAPHRLPAASGRVGALEVGGSFENSPNLHISLSPGSESNQPRTPARRKFLYCKSPCGIIL